MRLVLNILQELPWDKSTIEFARNYLGSFTSEEELAALGTRTAKCK